MIQSNYDNSKHNKCEKIKGKKNKSKLKLKYHKN
jgi:hypothetical protein